MRWRRRRDQPGTHPGDTGHVPFPQPPRRPFSPSSHPLVTAGLLATAGPAAAIPFEGDPTPATCLRLERCPSAGPAGSTLFVSHGYVLVLSHDC